MTADIITMLDKLAEFESQLDALTLTREELIKKATPPEVAQAIAEIDSEFFVKFQAVSEKIDDLTNAVKAAVIQHGASVKGTYKQAVWNKGRVSWDSAKLDGLMIAFPALAGARKEGEPSVSIRTVK